MGCLEREMNQYISISGMSFQQETILINFLEEYVVFYWVENRLLIEGSERIKSYQINSEVLVLESPNITTAII